MIDLNSILALSLTITVAWLIGLERQNIGKDAGISSHVLVALGACAIAIMQQSMYQETLETALLYPNINIAVENQRIIAQVITGVGFIGAGVIMKSEKHIKGITTAATIWIVAIIGIMAGSGYLELAGIVGLFAVLFLYVRDMIRGINPAKKAEQNKFNDDQSIQ